MTDSSSSKEIPNSEKAALSIINFITPLIKEALNNGTPSQSLITETTILLNTVDPNLSTKTQRTALQRLVDLLAFAYQRQIQPLSNNTDLKKIYIALTEVFEISESKEKNESRNVKYRLKEINQSKTVRDSGTRLLFDSKEPEIPERMKATVKTTDELIKIMEENLSKYLAEHLNENHVKKLQEELTILKTPTIRR